MRYVSYKNEYGKVTLFVTLCVLIVVFIYLIYAIASPKKLRVTFFDVGQGDAIFVETPSGKSMLIDGGPTRQVLESLADEMSYFDTDIDVMVATHPDADHVTGLIPVLENYDVKKIIMSPVVGHTKIFDDLDKHVKDEHADVYVAATGDVIDFQDGVVAKILHPSKKSVDKILKNKNDTNDGSVSMEIMYGDETFLLTGDLSTAYEGELVAGGLDKNITVYKAGHHGSKYSSGEQLLTYIRPEYAVISAGKNNRYGHPNSETIDRLQKYSKEIVSTVDKGAISFVTDGRVLSIETNK